jgi:hypothetical protein
VDDELVAAGGHQEGGVDIELQRVAFTPPFDALTSTLGAP